MRILVPILQLHVLLVGRDHTRGLAPKVATRAWLGRFCRIILKGRESIGFTALAYGCPARLVSPVPLSVLASIEGAFTIPRICSSTSSPGEVTV